MGVYINPPGETKEEFLQRRGREVPGPVSVEPGQLLVCWVDNGPFTAAAVAYNEGEVEAFTQASDRRPKRWYVLPKDEETLATIPEQQHDLLAVG